MMLIWLVRMSVTNDWKTYLHLNPYLLEAIHSVIVIQFDLRVMIEWRSNNQIFFHLNPYHLPVIHSDIAVWFDLRVMIEDEMIVRSTFTGFNVCRKLFIQILSFSSIWE